MSAYMRMMVPLIGALAGGKRTNNPWSILFDTFKLLPTNGELRRMISGIFNSADMDELSLGGLVVLVSEKNKGA